MDTSPKDSPQSPQDIRIKMWKQTPPGTELDTSTKDSLHHMKEREGKEGNNLLKMLKKSDIPQSPCKRKERRKTTCDREWQDGYVKKKSVNPGLNLLSPLHKYFIHVL